MTFTQDEIDTMQLAADCLANWMEIADPEDVRDYDEEALSGLRLIINKIKSNQ